MQAGARLGQTKFTERSKWGKEEHFVFVLAFLLLLCSRSDGSSFSVKLKALGLLIFFLLKERH